MLGIYHLLTAIIVFLMGLTVGMFISEIKLSQLRNDAVKAGVGQFIQAAGEPSRFYWIKR